MNEVTTASVAIVDNDGALCELLRNRLNDEPGLVCAGQAWKACATLRRA